MAPRRHRSKGLSVIVRDTSILLAVVTLLGAALLPVRAQAQWWPLAQPRDFEECLERADKTAPSKDARASLLAECEAKFAGRRKPGGGYTYYDFMQNRHFDIAGPNPTAEELREIDEQYAEYLDRHRRSIIAAAFSAKQRQQTEEMLAKQQAAQPAEPPRARVRAASLTASPGGSPSRSTSASASHSPGRSPRHPAAAAPSSGPSPGPSSGPSPARRSTQCRNDPLSCGLAKLSAGFDSVKKSLLGPAKKPARSGT
jgi:hypothetical protein